MLLKEKQGTPGCLTVAVSHPITASSDLHQNTVGHLLQAERGELPEFVVVFIQINKIKLTNAQDKLPKVASSSVPRTAAYLRGWRT